MRNFAGLDDCPEKSKGCLTVNLDQESAMCAIPLLALPCPLRAGLVSHRDVKPLHSGRGLQSPLAVEVWMNPMTRPGEGPSGARPIQHLYFSPYRESFRRAFRIARILHRGGPQPLFAL